MKKFKQKKMKKNNFLGGDKMAYRISDKCIMCGACAGECPVEAINEGEDRYVIDSKKCIECGACASVCPVGAPEPTDN
jgi:ferredoxin